MKRAIYQQIDLIHRAFVVISSISEHILRVISATLNPDPRLNRGSKFTSSEHSILSTLRVLFFVNPQSIHR